MQHIQVNVHEAKARLSELINLAEAGNTVTISRYNQPIIEFKLLNNNKKPRTLGAAPGTVVFLSDPDEPLPDELFESLYSDKI